MAADPQPAAPKPAADVLRTLQRQHDLGMRAISNLSRLLDAARAPLPEFEAASTAFFAEAAAISAALEEAAHGR